MFKRTSLCFNASLLLVLVWIMLSAYGSGQVSVSITSQKVTVGKTTITVQVATLPPGGWHPVLALGNDRVGGVEDLGQMAKRLGAVLAVNGTFFNPEDYAKSNRLPTEPYGTLISDGKVLHVGNRGGIIAFTVQNQALIVPLRVSIEGGTDGSYAWPHNWYAYGVNHTPAGANANSVYIYTPERGDKVGFTYGTKVVVSQGKVTSIVHNLDVAIPRDGYVIALTGTEKNQLLSRFSVGTSVTYRTKMLGPDKTPLQIPALHVAVGAGPILMSKGRVLTDYASQGFSGDKIITQKGRRTALGIKPHGSIIIAVADNLYMQDMASVMQALGVQDALNLDGGASSGLWAHGKYIVSPGRRLSNALLFVPVTGP